MDDSTRKLVGQLETSALDVLEISGNSWIDAFSWRSYVSRQYPEFDVCNDKILMKYDLIIAEQVFEHLRFPNLAIANIFNALRPGGYCLITTPFLFHVHPTPLDCWRWTPQGLAFFLEDAGFGRDRIFVDAWGNLECLVAHSADPTKAPEYNGTQSLDSAPHLPIVVWGFAQRAGQEAEIVGFEHVSLRATTSSSEVSSGVGDAEGEGAPTDNPKVQGLTGHHPIHRYSISLVACSRWEELDIAEWVAYHKSIGIDHIYLYSNDDDPNIQFKRVLPYLLGCDPFITYLYWPHVGQQLDMYLHFLENFKTETKWASFLDIDEFIVIKSQNDIQQLLAEYDTRADAIYLNWVNFGNNGRKTRDEESILLTRTRRAAKPSITTKTIFRTERVTAASARLGLCETNLPFTHFWNKYPFENFVEINVLGEDMQDYADEYPRRALEIVSRPAFADECLNKAYVAHFIFKAEEDFVRRVKRGGFANQIIWQEAYDDKRHVNILDTLNEVEDAYLRDYWNEKIRPALRFVPAIS
jgi:hypothetical protein